MTAVSDAEDDALVQVRRLPPALEAYREMLLANLVMLGEIPAPTFGEAERARFLEQRFTECGLLNCSTDEMGNAVGVLPGRSGGRSILVTAHIDTPFAAQVNHTVVLDPNRVVGPGVADNGLGLAVLATLPTLLEGLDLPMESDLVLLGATRSLGRGNMAGLRFFLSHNDLPLYAGLAIEGVQLGRLNYASLAALDGEIACRADDTDDEDAPGAIFALNAVIDGLRERFPLDPSGPRMVLGAVEGGTSFKTPARTALLRFQIRCREGVELPELAEQVEAITDQVAADTGMQVELAVIARRNAGGLTPQHPMVLEARRVMTALGIPPRGECCSTAISSFAEQDLPALTIGLSSGRALNQLEECVDIEPMARGVAQLIGILRAVDGGCCV